MSILKTYHLFLLAGVSLLISALASTNDIIDFHVHDTYFVTTRSSVFWMLAVVTYFLWGMYFLSERILLAKTLTLLHVGLTLFAIVLLICLPLFSSHKRYMDLTPWSSFNRFNRTHFILELSIGMLAIAQMVFFINIIGGVFKWLARR